MAHVVQVSPVIARAHDTIDLGALRVGGGHMAAMYVVSIKNGIHIGSFASRTVVGLTGGVVVSRAKYSVGSEISLASICSRSAAKPAGVEVPYSRVGWNGECSSGKLPNGG